MDNNKSKIIHKYLIYFQEESILDKKVNRPQTYGKQVGSINMTRESSWHEEGSRRVRLGF